LQFDLVVRTQQIRRHLDFIDAHGDVQRVGDDVLGEVERRIEDVVPGDPARLRAVAGRDLLLPMALTASDSRKSVSKERGALPSTRKRMQVTRPEKKPIVDNPLMVRARAPARKQAPRWRSGSEMKNPKHQHRKDVHASGQG